MKKYARTTKGNSKINT